MIRQDMEIVLAERAARQSRTAALPREASQADPGGDAGTFLFETVIEGGRPPGLVEGLRELWAYREVILAFAERNVRVKYKHTTLGILWALIQPLSFLGIFTIVFARAGGLAKAGNAYPAFALAMLVPWMFIQTSVSFGANALLSDGALVKKVYFAREAPVLAAVLSACVDFAIGLGLIAVVGPFLGLHFTWTALLVIPLFLTLVVLASGTAMALCALSVYYRDLRHVMPIFLQLWMFASPVAYPLSMVPDPWRKAYIVANPAAVVLDGFRAVLTQGRMPDLHLSAIGVVGALIVGWTGYRLFKYLEPGFADTL